MVRRLEEMVPMRRFMVSALFALLVAALTGVLLRFGLFMGMPSWAQNFQAVRHAHSHLMYFGWATLAIMAMIWRLLPAWTQAPLPRGVVWQMRVTSIFAFLSFPAFWSNGYGVTEIGSVSLPLGSMISGWNGVMWFLFALLYGRATAGLVERPLPIQLWDWAILLLMLSCAGALGMVILIAIDSPSIFLHQATLHLFLELFATGWFTLALLGLLWAWVGQQRALPRWLPTQSLALFIAPTFFLGVSPALLPMHIFWISAVANAGAALLLAWHLWQLWRYRDALPPLARGSLVALGVHLVVGCLLLWPGLWQWSAGTQLRIFYLHNLLLGWTSSALIGLALALWFSPAPSWRRALSSVWAAGVSFMLLSLLGLGFAGLWPVLPPVVWLRLAAWSSVLIAGSIGGIVLASCISHKLPQPAQLPNYITPHPIKDGIVKLPR
jgi:hypothetical protein